MAVQTHSVTHDDVLDELPFATGGVTATSDGLNTGQIDGWITRGAARVNSILSSRSVPIDSLDENQSSVVRQAIIAYAKAKCLEVREFPEDRVGRVYGEWRGLLKTLRSTLSDLGDAVDETAEVKSNVDTSSDKKSTKFGTEFRW